MLRNGQEAVAAAASAVERGHLEESAWLPSHFLRWGLGDGDPPLGASHKGAKGALWAGVP